MKKKKVAIILAVIAVTGVTAYLIYRRYSGGKDTPSGSNSSSSEESTLPASTSGVFPLKRGSSGNEVRHLQRWLNSTGPAPYANLDPTITYHSPVDVDGKFGPKTEASLRQATKGMYTYVTKAYYDMKNMQNF